MNKYDAYDFALKVVNKMNNPIMPTGKQVLTADNEYLCKQLEPIIEAYEILKGENYEKKYKELEGKIKKAYLYAQTDSTKAVLEDILPELAESEDEKIRKSIIENLKGNMYRADGDYDLLNKQISWLEKQEGCEHIRKDWLEHIKQSWYKEGFIDGKYSGVTSKELSTNDAVTLKELIDFLENGTAKLQHDITRYANWLKIKFTPIEKQGDKPQDKSALEAWKDMRFEVYAQASGNKHEPNDSDDTTKMFSLNDIDEIIEKINEQMKKVDNQNCVKGDDEIGQKFHEGDWIVWENQYYKVNYNGCGYELVDQNGLSTSLEYGTVDENAHHWDIAKDAKEGDVLISDNIVFIFNKIHDVWINCHCSLFKDDSFYGGDFDLMHIRYGKEVFPATKSQRDALMKAMADAGYEWDAENKELKKIEPKFKVKYAGREYNVLEIKESAGVTFYGIEDEPNHIDYVLSDDCEIISGYGEKEKGSPYPTKSAIFSEQNPAWSEEDENVLEDIKTAVTSYWSEDVEDAILDWLKSLKDKVQPQKQWKPSDEQIDAFEHFVKSIGESGFAYPHNHNTKCVYSLLNDLKKL